jgi:hypothetical protein
MRESFMSKTSDRLGSTYLAATYPGSVDAGHPAEMPNRRSGYEAATRICWQFGDKVGWVWRCECPACSAPDHALINFGRCRSGRRWFWVTSVFSLGQNHEEQGFANSEEAAWASIREAVIRLANSQPAIAIARHSRASYTLKELNKAKRAARPAPDTSETLTVEYLYTLVVRHPSFGPSETYIKAFPIVRKTKKRIFYKRDGIRFWPEPPLDYPHLKRFDDEIGYVDRQKLEAEGYVYNHGRHWCEDDFHLCLRPPYPESELPPDLQALKAAMAAAHPDRGGSSAAFIEARKKYVAARRAARRAS